MNRVFKAITVPEEQVAVRCYSEKNYRGYCVALPEGKFTQADLAVYGLKANDLSSFEIVDDFYQVLIYNSTNCTGTRLKRTSSAKQLSTSYDNKVCSIIIEPNPTRINEIENGKPKDEKEGAIYNLAGQRLQKMQKGMNIVNGKKILF